MGCDHVNETVMFESVTYEQGGSRMMRITTCEPGCGCVNWLVMFGFSVVMCERDVVV